MAFNVAADAYDSFMGRFSRRLAPVFADFAGVGAGQRVVDVGAGTGALTAELAQRGAETAAAEPSAAFVAALRARFPGVDVQEAAAEELPWPDESFDAANAQGGWGGLLDGDAGIAKFVDDGSEVERFTVGDREVAVGDGAGDKESASFDAIGNDGVLGSAKGFGAANAESGSAIAFDVCAHFAEEDDEVGDFRFARGIFEDGFAVGEGGGHKNVFCSGDGDFVERDARAIEAAGSRGAPTGAVTRPPARR